MVIWSETKFARYFLTAALLLLLLVNIRNAWDLTLSRARRQTAPAVA